ncbi:MAG: SIMPL domain-containing protein [Cyanothece sp. SIO1E1]|nr:SIMPL domain-containing protein [Cyanothece sp. SIO1E1]
MVLGLLSLAPIGPATAQATRESLLRTLTVTGQGSESIPTTLTQVRLGVEVQGNTAEAAQQEAAERSDAVVQLLRSRNVEKLQTTGIRLNPIYNFESQQRQITGYSATNTVSFQIATERAGSILDDAVKTGATRIDGVSFMATEAAIATARQQALRAATQAAQTQAEAVLSELGLTQQAVVGIAINGATPPPIPVDFGAARFSAEAAATPVVGGEQDVRASVTLQMSY